ncbi:hypothetical protein [Bacillus phage SPbetaL1]|nr:hypothetical protein HS3_01134 [Bacillus subtilis]WIT26944.1 hypothetical protein [Bacillus phage SPbetaL1]CAF1773480.1 hypothetical protein NRS6103_03939 [Bacillus subtilis]CAI6275440.1 SPbeta prophage-derived putative protein YoqE [Bacillus subtilis]
MRIGGIKMENEVSYGVYSTQSRKFCFGIKEPSKTKARKKLFERIGTDAYKWRFEIRKIKRK